MNDILRFNLTRAVTSWGKSLNGGTVPDNFANAVLEEFCATIISGSHTTLGLSIFSAVLLALCAATFVCAWRTRRDKNDALSKIDVLEAHVKKLISERDELIKKVKAQGVGSPQDSGINEPSTIATAGSATSTPRPSAPMSIDYDVRRPLEFQDSAMRVAGTPVNPNVLSRRQRSGSSSNLGSPKNYLDFAEELRRGRKD